ncbi:MAG: ATP synthase F1 subunit gamma, partial [Chloroflexi bacterium]|nr:ATP synthase F1 subunit gamma [Chloroflexota bacterium]
MATAREIRRRIRSVKNISQVTRAMEAVSASKMRRAQAQVVASRAYAHLSWEILIYLAAQAGKGEVQHPLLEIRKVNKVGIVLITPDRGLTGGMNGNVIRAAVRVEREQTVPITYINVGRKGRDFMARFGRDIHAEFTGIPDRPSAMDVSAISRLIVDDFMKGEFDQVLLVYTDFISTISQKPTVRQLLPVTTTSEFAPEGTPEGNPLGRSVFDFEPDAPELLSEIVPRFIQLQLYQAVLENIASEHSARMVAMRN